MKNKMFQNKVLTCQVSNNEFARLCHLESGPAGYKSVSMFPEVKGEPTKEELKEKDKSLENPETPDGRNAIRAQSILYLRKYQLDKEHREPLDYLNHLIQVSVRSEVGTPEPDSNPPKVEDKIGTATVLKAELDYVRAAYVESANDKKTLKQEPLTIPEDPAFPEGRNKIRSAAQKVLNESKVDDSNKANLAQLRSLLKLSYYAETGELFRINDKSDAMSKIAKDQGKTEDEQTTASNKVWIETFGKDAVYPKYNGTTHYPKTEKNGINQSISTALLAKLDEIAPNRNEKPAAPAAQPAATPAKPEAAAPEPPAPAPTAAAPAASEATAPAPATTLVEGSLEKYGDRAKVRDNVQRWLDKYKYEAATNELKDLLDQLAIVDNRGYGDYKSPEAETAAKTLKEKFDAAIAAHKDVDGKEIAPKGLTLDNENITKFPEGIDLIRVKARAWEDANRNHPLFDLIRILHRNSDVAIAGKGKYQAVKLNNEGQEILMVDEEGKPIYANIGSTDELRRQLVKLDVK